MLFMQSHVLAVVEMCVCLSVCHVLQRYDPEIFTNEQLPDLFLTK